MSTQAEVPSLTMMAAYSEAAVRAVLVNAFAHHDYVGFSGGLTDRIGRSTQKIIQSCVDPGLRPPQWEDRETGMTLTLWGPDGAAVAPASLNARQRPLLGVMKVDERIRPVEFRERFEAKVSERRARRDLVAIEEQGLLRMDGAGAATAYVLTNRT